MVLSSPEKKYNFKSKVKGTLKSAVIGDIHLGHNRTITPEICSKLHQFLLHHPEFPTLDYLILNGDVFDKALPRNDPWSLSIDTFVYTTLIFCQKYKVALRVLAGTHSHDMDQTKIFLDMMQMLELDLDFAYYTDITVEIDKRTGLSMLFVPDDWDTDLNNTYSTSVKRMADAGLEKVDVVYMHGAFEYQLPPQAQDKTHDSTSWQKLAEYGIFVNHVHQRSRKGIIVAPASFDRLSFGDEGPKGYVIHEISKDGLDYRYVDNTRAKPYLDIDCRGLSVEESLAVVDNAIKGLEKGSWIRLLANDDDNISRAKEYFRVTYSHLYWDDKIFRQDVEVVSGLLPEEIYKPVALTKDMLPGLLQRRMVAKEISPMIIEDAMALIMEHL